MLALTNLDRVQFFPRTATTDKKGLTEGKRGKSRFPWLAARQDYTHKVWLKLKTHNMNTLTIYSTITFAILLFNRLILDWKATLVTSITPVRASKVIVGLNGWFNLATLFSYFTCLFKGEHSINPSTYTLFVYLLKLSVLTDRIKYATRIPYSSGCHKKM